MRTVLGGAVTLLLGSTLLFAHGAQPWPVPEKAKRRKNPVPVTAESLREGAALFRSQCEVCHGPKGEGNGPWVEKLRTRPADLTDRQMMSEMTDGEIFWKISKGRDEMPRFETQLSESQRWHLVNYLRAFAREPTGSPGAEPGH
ncbi:MAG: cytochrome c [Acidobacteria bacterium]|nr:cytochrome c [Acidobacteriota bacterium]